MKVLRECRFKYKRDGRIYNITIPLFNKDQFKSGDVNTGGNQKALKFHFITKIYGIPDKELSRMLFGTVMCLSTIRNMKYGVCKISDEIEVKIAKVLCLTTDQYRSKIYYVDEGAIENYKSKFKRKKKCI